MSRDEIKSALRARIVNLRQTAKMYRDRGGKWNVEAREQEARALECERCLDLFGK